MAGAETALAELEPLTGINEPFQPALRYRSDDYSTLRFKLLERLGEAVPRWNPALVDADGPEDLAVAFCELFAYLGEIHEFYLDRRANEPYLRTAVLPGSVIDVCSLIDYRVAPGASASVLQAFLVKADKRGGTVPRGFQLSADGKTAPVIFETGRELEANKARNAMRLAGWDRSARRLCPIGDPADDSLLLDGGYGGLEAGSFVVLTARGGSPRAVQLTAVTDEGERRRIHWADGAVPAGAAVPLADLTVLGKPKAAMPLALAARADEITAGTTAARVATPSLLSDELPVLFTCEGFAQAARITRISSHNARWDRGFPVSLRRSLTRIHPGQHVGNASGPILARATEVKLTVSGPFAVEAGDVLLLADAAGVEPAKVAGTSGQTIYLSEPPYRALRGTSVGIYAVRPPGEGVFGATASTGLETQLLAANITQLTLDDTYEGLESGALVAISDGTSDLARRITATTIDEHERTVITIGAQLGAQLDPSTTRVHGPFLEWMRAEGHDRSELSTSSGTSAIEVQGLAPGLKPGDRLVVEGGGSAEGARVDGLHHARGRTVIDLELPLARTYPLAETVVYGNVIEVSEGKAVVSEVLGGGDRSKAGQRFPLRGNPLTFVHDPAGRRGVSSTLELFVGGVRWHEVESLAESGPEDRHFVVEVDEDRKAAIQLGDDHNGRAAVSGRDNVVVNYRIGMSREGNVGARSIETMPAPLPFLDATVNPVAASGGADRETIPETRRLAPLTVRTLDRAVSLSDYRDLAASYAGIAKAGARWEWDSGRRNVVVTVAAVDGNALGAELAESLRSYLEARRSPSHRLTLRDHQRVPLRLMLEVSVLPDFIRQETKQRAIAALGKGLDARGRPGFFSFDRLEIGQDVYLSDVYASVEAVPGVDTARVTAFQREQPGGAISGPPQDRIAIPADAIASGGTPADRAQGVLTVSVSGGII